MQISKTLVTCGAAALCFVAVSARAADTTSDAQLREALRQKISELKAKSAAPAPTTAAPQKPAPVVEKPTPAPVPAITTPAPTVTAPTAEEEAETAELLKALHERMAQEGPFTETPVAKAAAKQPKMTKTPAVKSTPRQATQPTVAKTGTFTPVPLQPPAIPVSAAKEAQLHELLQQYKADQISPEQYHEQRAKILAE